MDAIEMLEGQKRDLLSQVKRIERAIKTLGGKSGGSKRTMSAATRRKMRLSAKKRWAEQKSKKAS